jgi:arabinofuranosyltransferase
VIRPPDALENDPPPGQLSTWHLPSFVVCVAAALFAYLWFHNSWVGEDAYITGRTVSNALDGYGLRWNVNERVQTYTHPLWMLLLLPLQATLRDFHWAAIALSLICNGLLLLVIRRLVGADTSLFGLFVLVAAGSRAFFDFTSSGLENPLTSLLLAAYVLTAQSSDAGRRCSRLLLLASCVFLNRMDSIILLAPSVAAVALAEGRATGPRRALRLGLRWVLVTSPAWLWLAFSVLYYGFPFPNTAYAKLSTGVDRIALLTQGLAYFRQTLTHDPLTPLMILGASLAVPALAIRRRAWPTLLLALGIPLQCAYLVWVGGDFMAGRFLSPAFSLALVLALVESRVHLAKFPEAQRWAALLATAGVLALYAAVLPRGPIRTFLSYKNFETDEAGIADEKGYYHYRSSLGVRLFRKPEPFPNHRFVSEGLRFRALRTPVTVECNVGYFGYYAGPSKTIIDECGLTDPLLSRLPALPEARIGHFIRAVPLGYADAILHGDAALLGDPALRKPYGELLQITRGPLLSTSRLRLIARWNLDLPVTATLGGGQLQSPGAEANNTTR